MRILLDDKGRYWLSYEYLRRFGIKPENEDFACSWRKRRHNSYYVELTNAPSSVRELLPRKSKILQDYISDLTDLYNLCLDPKPDTL